jgi:hypothetical protein
VCSVATFRAFLLAYELQNKDIYVQNRGRPPSVGCTEPVGEPCTVFLNNSKYSKDLLQSVTFYLLRACQIKKLHAARRPLASRCAYNHQNVKKKQQNIQKTLRFMLHAAPPNSCFCEQFCWKVTCSQQRIARTFVIAWKNKVARGFLQPHDYCLSPPQREIFLNFLRYFVTGRPRKDRP